MLAYIWLLNVYQHQEASPDGKGEGVRAENRQDQKERNEKQRKSWGLKNFFSVVVLETGLRHTSWLFHSGSETEGSAFTHEENRQCTCGYLKIIHDIWRPSKMDSHDSIFFNKPHAVEKIQILSWKVLKGSNLVVTIANNYWAFTVLCARTSWPPDSTMISFNPYSEHWRNALSSSPISQLRH